MSEYIILKIGEAYTAFSPNGNIIRMMKEISKIMDIEVDYVFEKAIDELYQKVKETRRMKNPKACERCKTIFDDYTGKMKFCSRSCINKNTAFLRNKKVNA
jgi:protein-arginine kinase activator protein McsA